MLSYFKLSILVILGTAIFHIYGFENSETSPDLTNKWLVMLSTIVGGGALQVLYFLDNRDRPRYKSKGYLLILIFFVLISGAVVSRFEKNEGYGFLWGISIQSFILTTIPLNRPKRVKKKKP